MADFTKEEKQILRAMELKYQEAKSASKEGVGTPRGCGMAGRIAAEWIRLRLQAKSMGLI